jgi:hypothetical protein
MLAGYEIRNDNQDVGDDGRGSLEGGIDDGITSNVVGQCYTSNVQEKAD